MKKSMSIASSLLLLLAACGAPPASPPSYTPATTATPDAVPRELVWECAFDNVDGWIDGSDDKSAQSTFAADPDGTAALKQTGDQAAGYTAFTLPALDPQRAPVVNVVLTDVKGAWSLGVVTTDTVQTVIPANSDTGTRSAPLPDCTARPGAQLRLAVIGVGASATFDKIAIWYTN